MDNMQIQAIAAEHLRKKAVSMGLHGVGGVLILPDGETKFTPTLVVVGDMKRLPDPGRGPEDHGSNYIAVAFSKLAEMIVTSNNSGTTIGRLPMKGEFGYPGGVIQRIGKTRIFAFFSGGKAEEDVMVAEEALPILVPSAIRRKLLDLATGGPDPS
jgi:hypothetical protein